MEKKMGHPMIDKHSELDIPSAIDHLKKAIKIHTGHMDGSVPDNRTSEAKEMNHLDKALTALTGKKGMT